MMTGALIALAFLILVLAPCAIGLRIRASLHPADRVPRRTHIVKL